MRARASTTLTRALRAAVVLALGLLAWFAPAVAHAAVGWCDRGLVSVEAPPTRVPVKDGAVRAAERPCEASEGWSTAGVPVDHERPAPPASPDVPARALPSPFVMPRPSNVRLPAAAVERSTPRAAHTLGVFRPPRA